MAPKIDIKTLLRDLPKKLPLPARIAIAIVPALIAALAFWYFGVRPKTAQIAVLKGEVATQESDIAKKTSMAARLDVLKEENEKLKQRLIELEELLPEEKEISSLLKQVSDLGLESGLQILTWNPSERRKHQSGIVYEVPVSVSLSGSYHRLGRFFARLTGLERIVNISDIRLGGPRPSGNEAALNVGFSAVTFTAIPAEEAPKK